MGEAIGPRIGYILMAIGPDGPLVSGAQHRNMITKSEPIYQKLHIPNYSVYKLTKFVTVCWPKLLDIKCKNKEFESRD